MSLSLGMVSSASGARVGRSTRSPSVAAPCGSTGPHARYQHVVWIILENVGTSVMGSSSAPFLNHLAAICGVTTDYHAVSHPSLPNYIALTSGSTQGIGDDGEPSSHPLHVASIFSELRGDWRSFAESMPAPCDRVTSGTYAARHNPAVYYLSLGAACRRSDLPMPSVLPLDAKFTFIAPNVCDDMHSCPVAIGDAWLERVVPSIIKSPEYQAGRLVLFVTFDENDGDATNTVPTFVVAPSVPRGLRVAAPFTHYSLLRTTEELLDVPLLGGARTARSMTSAFHLANEGR